MQLPICSDQHMEEITCGTEPNQTTVTAITCSIDKNTRETRPGKNNKKIILGIFCSALMGLRNAVKYSAKQIKWKPDVKTQKYCCMTRFLLSCVKLPNLPRSVSHILYQRVDDKTSNNSCLSSYQQFRPYIIRCSQPAFLAISGKQTKSHWWCWRK